MDIVVAETISNIVDKSGTRGKCEELDVSKPNDGEENKIRYLDPSRKTHFKAKTGKFLRKYFGHGKSDQVILNWGSETNARLWGLDRVKLVTGEEIIEVYATLPVGGCNCMGPDHPNRREFMKLYANNPDAVSLIHVTMGNGVARCLIWDTNEGVKAHSAIYHSSDTAKEALNRYIKSKGYENLLKSGSQYSVCVNYTIDDVWPYIDGLSFIHVVGKNIQVLTTPGYNLSYDYIAQATNGCIDGREHATCSDCEELINEDDVRNYGDDPYCEICFNNSYMFCNRCDDVCCHDSTTEICGGDYVCENCVSHYYTMCVSCDTYRDNEFVEEAPNEEYYCNICYEENVCTCSVCESEVMISDFEDDKCMLCVNLEESSE